MKNLTKLFGIIAVVAMIIFSMGCDFLFEEPPPPTPPPTPTSFRVVDPMNSSSIGVFGAIHLQWSGSSSADGYRILRSNTATGSYTQIHQTTGTSYQDTSLGDGTRRFYKIKAYNSAGESAESAVIVGTTAFSTTAMGSLSGNVPFSGSFTRRDLLAGETHYYFINATNNNFGVAWGDYDRTSNTNLVTPYADIEVGIRFDGDASYVYEMCDWGSNGPTKNSSAASRNYFAFDTSPSQYKGWYTVVVKGYVASSAGNYSIGYRLW